MNIELTSHAQSVLQRHLSSGDYASPADLIEHALDLLDAQEPTMESLKAKIQVGLDEMATGLGAPLDAEDIIRRGEARLAAKCNRGHSGDRHPITGGRCRPERHL